MQYKLNRSSQALESKTRVVWKVCELSSKKKREENNANLFCNPGKKIKEIKVS